MRHMDREAGMAVENTRIDKSNGRHDQRKFASDRARGVVAVELLGLVELQCRMHEYEHAELLALRPERLELRRVEIEVVGLGRDHHAGKAEIVLAAAQLAQGLCAPERIGMRRTDETAGIIAFSPLGGLVAQARFV